MSLIFTVLQVLLLLTIMQIMGIQMTVFAALVGGIGVAAGLALSGTLQNFTSGILILLLKPYKVGEKIIMGVLQANHSAVLLSDPAPRVGIAALEGDGYHIAINVWAQPHGFMDSKLDVQVRLVEALKSGGIKFIGMP